MAQSRVTDPSQMSRSYGFTEVKEGEKQPLVDSVFDRVAERYDIMNDLMSAGMHRLWKDAMVARLAPRKDEKWHSIDVAGGTGDIAFRIVEASGRKARTTICDINRSMLEVGQKRAAANGLDKNLDFVEANAEKLPFEAGSFDGYTIAFGIRNVPDMAKALEEAYRVLKYGSQFICLEFSQVDVPGLEQFYEKWSANVIPRIGRIVTGDDEPYRYLVESIARFPNQQSFAAMISEAGFSRTGYRNLSGGIVAMHWGWKL
ncbi:MAG: bifunctional demethylmenaquinone methyltransferase/2-methoxy-6-polyprenyl-1,4-benzoquinol methylase UbiE [Pseudomonadota bacterium]